MSSPIAAIAVTVVLATWHRSNRRHAGWRASPDGRFNVFSGYALVTFAVYWLVSAPTATAWEWALGCAWALAAMFAFVSGFEALNRVTAQHALLSQAVESTEPSTGALRSQG